MILPFKNSKQKLRSVCRQAGMTYVELIVVLGIFATMSGVVMFNHQDFQGKVDIQNLGSEIALRIVEAQRNAMSGVLTVQNTDSSWRPSYGVYFSKATNGVANNKAFIFFADASPNKLYTDSSCVLPPTPNGGECLDKVNLTKGNTISELEVFYQGGSVEKVQSLTFVYTRPDSGASIRGGTTGLPVLRAEVTISSPSGALSKVVVYPSGRIELN